MPDTKLRIPLRSPSAPSVLPHSATPIRFQKPKRIHPRRLLPSVKEGVDRQCHSTTPAARADSPPLAVPADELTLVINSELAGPAQSQTSANVGEPSAAINGNVVFYTGNWYAAMSSDGGKTFLYVDPRTTQQGSDPAGVTFCCDQIVHYIPSIDTFVLLLQYSPKEGNNIQRLDFATTAQLATTSWPIFDIT